ncbi:uncharacterized protein [Diadema antillarum]|uniref:uncharacterized protein n=1 Tax=Diadema antillarum TaxID=105358 RepID=UPI003A8A23C0
MFHASGNKNSRSGNSSSSIGSSPRTLSEDNDKPSSDDEIQTILGSSDASQVSSIVLGQSSSSQGRMTRSYGSTTFESEDEETSRYSTAYTSSFDSRQQSETFYTATNRSGTSQTGASSTPYSDTFDTESSSTTSYEGSVTESDLADVDAERRFLRLKLRLLKKAARAKPQTEQEDRPVDVEFDSKCTKFISTQLNALKYRKAHAGEHRTSRTSRVRKHQLLSESKDSLASPEIVSRGVVDRLRIENLLCNMRKFSDEPIHEPARCEHCKAIRTEADERDFIREKQRLAFNRLTEERYNKHVVTFDPLSQLGDLAANLPKLGDDPQQIWDRLLQKGVT